MIKLFITLYFLISSLILLGCDKKTTSGNSQNNSTSVDPLTPPRSLDSEIAALFNDPLLPYAWHFNSSEQTSFSETTADIGTDINLFEVWKDGHLGEGIKILVSDDGGQIRHEDLEGNVIPKASKNYGAPVPWLASPFTKDSSHGTAVAGIIAAVGNNGLGSLGVAPKAKFAIARYIGISESDEVQVDQASGDFDIFNYSYGFPQYTYIKMNELLLEQYKYASKNERNGKGAIYVKAAGNDFYGSHQSSRAFYFGNANMDGGNSSPYTILVGATNAKGESTSYSSPGSNLWISAPSGEFGEKSPAIITTDIEGCEFGLGQGPQKAQHLFYNHTALNLRCHYTSKMNGTSSSSPIISGVIALMLGANPDLTWRDVKYILASTAKNDLPSYKYFGNYEDKHYVSGRVTKVKDTEHPYKKVNEQLAGQDPYDQGWVTNAAGFKFHNWYGFGRVDTYKAVKMAVDYAQKLPEFKTDAKAASKQSLDLIAQSGSLENSLKITQDYKIEAVQIKLTIRLKNNTVDTNCPTRESCAQYGVKLTSPSGTHSVILPVYSNRLGINLNKNSLFQPHLTDAAFLSNAFFDESSSGEWTLKIIDPVKDGDTVILKKWSIQIYGHQK